MPFYAANILQAFLFAIIHINPIAFIYTFPSGLLNGYVVKKYKSIIPAIFIHMLGNASGILIGIYGDLLKIPKDPPILLFIVITLIGVFLFLVYYYIVKQEKLLDSRENVK